MNHRLPVLLAVLCCWLTALGAVVTAVQSVRFLRVAQPAVGTVVALREVGGGPDSTWAPVVEFTNHRGTAITFDVGLSSDPPAQRVGDRLPVLYVADHPETARLDHPLEFWLAPLVCSVLSVACGAFAWLVRSQG